MPLKCCLTLDDWNRVRVTQTTMEALEKLIEYFPNFKVNLFASGGLDIVDNPHPDKYAYLLHGWKHTNYEELTNEQLQSWKYDRAYRAPYWELTDVMYQRLKDNGYKILLDMEDTRDGIKYDWNIRFPPDLKKEFTLATGHVTNNINYVVDRMDNLLMLPKDTEFVFVRDL